MKARLKIALVCVLALCFCSRVIAQNASAKADFILVEKAKRQMTLYANGTVIKIYKVALGAVPVGAKEIQGDNKTPEGIYTIDSVNRASQYHLALHVSYPNTEDVARAKRLGKSPGGDIMIHGLPNRYAWMGESSKLYDWTAGCIALTNPEIEEIVALVPVGTRVEIKP